jgi:DUF4097 and DUF4098 domain-containing protein YvlB
MRDKTKIWLFAAVSLLLVGLILFGGTMTVLKWDFTKLSTVKYVTNEYIIEESVESISVLSQEADIALLPATDGKISVVCRERAKALHSASVEDGTLKIEVNDTRKWYDYIGFFFGAPKITVYLPEGVYGALAICTKTGSIEIPQAFTFGSIDIEESTGDVTSYASALGDINIKATTGSIHVEGISTASLALSVSTGEVTALDIHCAGDIAVSTSTGKTRLTDVNCQNLRSNGSTGDILLENVIATERILIERNTGDVRLEDADAAEILIETDTGNVTGTLLSQKVFIPRTDTGRIDVPKTAIGGRCEITTDTGDITISIKE